MYTQADFDGAKTMLKRFVLLYAALAVILLGLATYAVVGRIEWLMYVAVAVLTAASLFLWGNFGVRLFCWNRFLREMQRGLERDVEGVVASIDEEEAAKEGLEFRAMRLMTGESSDKAGGRLLYVETSRFPLKAQPGQKVNCRLYGNYVKDITVLGEE